MRLLCRPGNLVQNGVRHAANAVKVKRLVVSDHLGKNIQDSLWNNTVSIWSSSKPREKRHSYLINSLIVDTNQISGRWVDLEGLVESQGSLGGALGGIGGQLFADLYVLHEVALALVDARGEALLRGGVDGSVYFP